MNNTVIGIGTDIMHMERLRGLPLGFDDVFFKKTFTVAEREAALKRADPLAYFATRFAGKEAVFKTLHMDADRVRLDQIEIINEASGAPTVRLFGDVLLHAQRLGIKQVTISLSYDNDYATAFAVAYC